MNDRELLKLAAKAAGVGDHLLISDDEAHDGFRQWDPLTGDGDALRLAVRLKFHVGINPGNRVFCTPTYSDKPTIFESCERNGIQDEYAATRRAIVRAAAEIGKGMK